MFALCLSITMHFRSALSPKVDTAMDTHLLYEAPKSPTKTQSLAAARCNCRQKRWLYRTKLKPLFPATAHLPSGSGASLLEIPAPGDPRCCGTRPLLSPASPHRLQLTLLLLSTRTFCSHHFQSTYGFQMLNVRLFN